jgi:Spy/CpxP family protein refolding chaperone
MTRAKSLALAFYLGAALAGAALGISVDRMLVRPPQRFDQKTARTRFFDQLHLTGATRDSAAGILDAREAKLKSLMDSNKAMLAPFQARTDSIMEESRQRLSQLLTPEQKAIYDQMRRDRAQRTERR